MKTDFEPRLIKFPSVSDPRGNLAFIEGGDLLPFEIERVYWTYDVPSWRHRDGRALRTCAELIIATSGQCTVNIDRGDGLEQQFVLNRSDVGLYLPPMTWRKISDFVTGTTCVTLASKLYDEIDYIRDYQQFISALKDEIL